MWRLGKRKCRVDVSAEQDLRTNKELKRFKVQFIEDKIVYECSQKCVQETSSSLVGSKRKVKWKDGAYYPAKIIKSEGNFVNVKFCQDGVQYKCSVTDVKDVGRTIIGDVRNVKWKDGKYYPAKILTYVSNMRTVKESTKRNRTNQTRLLPDWELPSTHNYLKDTKEEERRLQCASKLAGKSVEDTGIPERELLSIQNDLNHITEEGTHSYSSNRAGSRDEETGLPERKLPSSHIDVNHTSEGKGQFQCLSIQENTFEEVAGLPDRGLSPIQNNLTCINKEEGTVHFISNPAREGDEETERPEQELPSTHVGLNHTNEEQIRLQCISNPTINYEESPEGELLSIQNDLNHITEEGTHSSLSNRARSRDEETGLPERKLPSTHIDVNHTSEGKGQFQCLSIQENKFEEVAGLPEQGLSPIQNNLTCINKEEGTVHFISNPAREGDEETERPEQELLSTHVGLNHTNEGQIRLQCISNPTRNDEESPEGELLSIQNDLNHMTEEGTHSPLSNRARSHDEETGLPEWKLPFTHTDFNHTSEGQGQLQCLSILENNFQEVAGLPEQGLSPIQHKLTCINKEEGTVHCISNPAGEGDEETERIEQDLPSTHVGLNRRNEEQIRLQYVSNSTGNGEESPINKPTKKRRCDRKNYCLYCDQLVSNFSRHLTRNHKDEEPVAQYISMINTCSEESRALRKKITDDLRTKGNYIYNQSVLAQGDGSNSNILPIRRPPVGKTISPLAYVTCKLCRGVFSKNSFRKHVPKCSEKDSTAFEMNESDLEDEDDPANMIRSRRCPNFIKKFGTTCHSYEFLNASLRKNVLPILQHNEATDIALKDRLLMAIVSDFQGNHLRPKDKYVITRKIHDGGRLLLSVMKKDPSISSLIDCLKPTKADIVFESVKEICGLDEDTGDVSVVGMPNRLSWILREAGARAVDDVIVNPSLSKEEKEDLRRDINDFLQVKKRRWRYIVSTNAEIARKSKKILKPDILPDDDDIKTFTNFLKDLEIKYNQKLKNDTSVQHYENLCEVVIARIMTLSRRRPTEAACAELRFYSGRKKSEHASKEIMGSLSEEERAALDRLDMFVVPGKNEHQVPVLLTEEMENSIELIISSRRRLGIPESNKYLFARPGLETPFSGTKVLTKLRQECPNLKKPTHLTATGLRHHCATMAQVHGDQFVDHLAKFMGHTPHIHKKSYQYPIGVLQRGVIGQKMLQMSEGAQTHSSLNNQHASLQQPLQEQVGSSRTNGAIPLPNTSCDRAVSRKKVKWTIHEKTIVIAAFKNYIKNKTNPGIKKCAELIETHPELSLRTPSQVNIMIDNLNKGKLKLIPELEELIV